MIVGAVNTSRPAASMLLPLPRRHATRVRLLPVLNSNISIVVRENLHEVNVACRDRNRSIDVSECGQGPEQSQLRHG
jgi:hypothetical protein